MSLHQLVPQYILKIDWLMTIWFTHIFIEMQTRHFRSKRTILFSPDISISILLSPKAFIFFCHINYLSDANYSNVI